MVDLKNRIALVTGGSRGIGRAIALALSEAGASVAVNYRERRDEAEAVIEAVQEQGGHAEAFRADVSIRAAVEGMIREIEKRLGPIDVLINNAGTAAARSLDDITEEDFDRSIAVLWAAPEPEMKSRKPCYRSWATRTSPVRRSR